MKCKKTYVAIINKFVELGNNVSYHSMAHEKNEFDEAKTIYQTADPKLREELLKSSIGFIYEFTEDFYKSISMYR